MSGHVWFMSTKQTIKNAGDRAMQSEAVRRITKRPSRRAVAVAGVALAVVSVPWFTGAHAETVELAAQSAAVTSDAAPAEAAKKARAKKASARKGADREDSDNAASKKVETEREVVQEAARKQAPAAPAQPRKSTSTGTGTTSSANGASGSSYRGSHYAPGYESLRQCIVHRESRGNYQARNPSSGASGAYQFLLSTSNEVARMMDRPDLVGRPAATWSHYEQDTAFWTLFDHGRGISHWGGRCG